MRRYVPRACLFWECPMVTATCDRLPNKSPGLPSNLAFIRLMGHEEDTSCDTQQMRWGRRCVSYIGRWLMNVITKIAVAVSALCLSGPALSQQLQAKFGILNDRSGLYADISGEGSVIATRMAIEDFKAAEKGIKAEVISGDHQNKPDVGATLARRWYDQEGV